MQSTVHTIQPLKRDYTARPLFAYWEITQACALACRHCRAKVLPFRHPLQLTHKESRVLLRQIAAFDDPKPHLIITGGDPMQRPDLFDLIDEAQTLGIKMSITPSATPNLTPAVIEQLKTHGLQRLSLSLDGSTPIRHAAVRGIEDCFDRTVEALQAAVEIGLAVQINTLVAHETADDLPAIYEYLLKFKIRRWSLFFLVAVGRGRVLQEVSSDFGERLMFWVYELSRYAPFAINTTEAPSYQRVALNRLRQAGKTLEQIRRTPTGQSFGIRDGHGVVFISNTGEIYPSGFLPLSAGNVRTENLAETYRSAPLFRHLHDPDQFKGNCGKCEYRYICGGSRARAFAHTGNPLESDPLCLHQPSAIASSPPIAV